MSTVVAISTPDAPGGIAVIRISGENALEVAEKVFTPYGGKNVSDMKGYTCAYGFAHDNGQKLDDCILTVFRSPHSYTGEDTAEISCHGGLYVTRRILRTVLKNGADNALAGEFTKRAFLNGKLDLTRLSFFKIALDFRFFQISELTYFCPPRYPSVSTPYFQNETAMDLL